MAYADGMTQSGSLDFSKAAYDRMAYFALRPELYFDQAADVQPTAQSMPGTSVTFTIVNDLSIAAAPITEATDVSAVSLSDSTVTLSLAEYGNAVITTAKLRGTSFVEIDPIVANVVGYNAGVSLDSVARNALGAGTQVAYAGSATSRITVAATDYLTAADIRKARARLRSQNVPTFGGMYVSYIHPDAVYDIQTEGGGSSAANWRDPHIYSQPGEIWSGELGAFEGVRFIETPRALTYVGAGVAGTTVTYTLVKTYLTTGTTGIPDGTLLATYSGGTPELNQVLTPSSLLLPAGTFVAGLAGQTVNGVTIPASNVLLQSSVAFTTTNVTATTATASADAVNVYGTLVLGRQALAKAHSIADGNGPVPHIVPGPVTDHLRRYVPMGWYWLGGYGVFRQASVYRIESSARLQADVNTTFEPPIDLGE